MDQQARPRFLRNDDGTVHANLTWRQRLSIALLAWLISIYIWLVRWTCTVEVVHGQQHLDEALARQIFIPCGWHQRLFVSGIFLATLQPRGIRAGFLISPSREGEFIARVARAHGTAVMRGSSTRTGHEAIVAMRGGLSKGISPMIFADGPMGPMRQCKPGAVLLSHRTGIPVLPIGCTIDRYWSLYTWDQTRIPKPFAHLKVALGPLRTTDYKRGDASVADVTIMLAHNLNELTAIADEH